jgi:alpha-ketoglutarate-dependent taurine dioxygenase
MVQFEIRDITPDFGAEIVGFEAVELEPETRDLLRRTFDERALLVFRDLDIDRDYQTYLIDALIDYDRPADAVKQRQREMLVSNKEPEGNAPFGRLLFHSDMMWAAEPFQVLSLYGIEVQAPAVPTDFVSTVAAWETLPKDLRQRVENLHVVNVTGQQRRGDDGEEDLLQPIREHEQSVTTSVGHTHPRTNRTILYVSQMNTREIVELSHDESEELIEELFNHLYDSAHVFRHEWSEGDLAAWDNLAIQHARSTVTKEGPVRTLRKVISPIPSMAGIETPKFSKVG